MASLNSENEEYVVEKILDKRVKYRKIQYLLKWKGYSDAENTWEWEQNMDCADLIAEFESQLKQRQRTRRNLQPETEKDTSLMEKSARTDEVKLFGAEQEKNDLATKKKKPRNKKSPDESNVSPKTKLDNPEPNKKISEPGENVVKEVQGCKDDDKHIIKYSGQYTDSSDHTVEFGPRSRKKRPTRKNEGSDTATKSRRKKSGKPDAESEVGSKRMKTPETESDDFQQEKEKSAQEELVGFQRGLKPEKILRIARNKNDESSIMFLMKWKDDQNPDLVSSEEAREKCPLLVIEYYEGRLIWA